MCYGTARAVHSKSKTWLQGDAVKASADEQAEHIVFEQQVVGCPSVGSDLAAPALEPHAAVTAAYRALGNSWFRIASLPFAATLIASCCSGFVMLFWSPLPF
jgi:hypothetical protein